MPAGSRSTVVPPQRRQVLLLNASHLARFQRPWIKAARLEIDTCQRLRFGEISADFPEDDHGRD
ncbi:hypothetical protein CEJ86_22730 [Sinorhizobium meliloti]|uniref:Uncharacterized protein n=1 Tax=Rhizobium meliloti TaxID=382 RepID=A0A2J0YY58_RHIML|nr:hypothetical protein CEJ86_22730 [Sinorhizobium meliloti]